MSTIQRPYTHQQQFSNQQPTTAYDLIQQIQMNLKENNLQEVGLNDAAQVPSVHHGVEMKHNYTTMETIKDKLNEEIDAIERRISRLHKDQIKRNAVKEQSHAEKIQVLSAQKAELKAVKSSSEDLNIKAQRHIEKICKVQQRIEMIKAELASEHVRAIPAKIEVVTDATNADIIAQRSEVLRISSQLGNLKSNEQRNAAINEVLEGSLASLGETHRSLQERQTYCENQTVIYNQKVISKETQRRQVYDHLKSIEKSTNDLIQAKKSYLEQVIAQSQQRAAVKMNESNQKFSLLAAESQQAIQEGVQGVRAVNQRALEAIEAAQKQNYEQVKAARQRQLERLEAVLDEYWRYVNDGTFTIFNTHHKEYLYAAEYKPFDNERRHVFTWRPGGPVGQGNWKIEQSKDGSFCFFNLAHGEYMYAADYKPFDNERRQVFTWREGRRVEQGNWKLTNVGNNTYRIFNLTQKEYMYAADYKPFDDERRRVFTWRPGNAVSQGDWLIERIS